MAIYIKQLIQYLEREESSGNLSFEINNQEREAVKDILRKKGVDFRVYEHRENFSKLLVRMS